MNSKKAFFSFLFISVFLVGYLQSTEYLPVVLVHGLASDPYALKYAKKFIETNHPGTYVLNVRIGSGAWDITEKVYSEESMWKQLDALKSHIYADEQLQDGFHIIGHSQGGLLARAYVQDHYGNDFKVRRLITWGTPHAGEFGIPESEDKFGLEYEAYLAFYTKEFQKNVSFAQYWNDPLHHAEYLKKNTFLPILNNEIVHGNSKRFKDNICSLEKMVLFMSTRDEVVKPIESCWFGFYEYEKRPLMVIPLTDRPIYINDRLGLKELMEQVNLVFKAVDCDHTKYETDKVVLEETLKFLTTLDGDETNDSEIIFSEGYTTADESVETEPSSSFQRRGCFIL